LLNLCSEVNIVVAVLHCRSFHVLFLRWKMLHTACAWEQTWLHHTTANCDHC